MASRRTSLRASVACSATASFDLSGLLMPRLVWAAEILEKVRLALRGCDPVAHLNASKPGFISKAVKHGPEASKLSQVTE